MEGIGVLFVLVGVLVIVTTYTGTTGQVINAVLTGKAQA